MKNLFLLILLLFVGGCSGPKYNMVLGTEGLTPETRPVWPKNGTPRYMFSGLLYGDQNLVVDEEDAQKNFMNKVWSWIAGIFDVSQMNQLQQPHGGTVDKNGIVYVVDVGNAGVMVFDKKSKYSNQNLPLWIKADKETFFKSPIDIELGKEDELLVTDSELGRVFRLSREGEPLGHFGSKELNRPTGIARDTRRGLIFVADTHDHDIKVYDEKNYDYIASIGRRGERSGEFNFPTHMTFVEDQLYVVDMMNSRVQVFDFNGDFLFSFGEMGKFVGQFSKPKGIAVDSDGNIYVLDSYFDHLLIFNSSGKLLLAIGGTGSQVGEFYLPTGVWIDANDQIYISDMGNNRVVMMQFLGGD